MARTNQVVAALLEEYADLLAITGGQAYKVRVYEKASRAIAGHHTDVGKLDLAGLQEIPNVGKSIAEKVIEFRETGQISAIEKVRTKVPAGVRAMTEIPGLGPRKAMMLFEERKIASVADLEAAIEDGRLEGLRGFGPKTIENIAHGIALTRAGSGRVLIDVAMTVAEDIVAAISAVPGCLKCTYAGSLRRMRETIGDVDILAAAVDSKPLMRAFVELPLVSEVIVKGAKKTSVRTSRGFQVDLRVVPPECWGAALQYFTGSKQHNVRTREIAVRKGLKLSEYGLFKADDDTLVISETEEEVYAELGLAYVAPTLREDRGEVDAALNGTLPKVVTLADIRGDLHTHTTLTDGVSSLDEMLAAAQARGLEYYAVTDHAKNLPMQRMTDAKMRKQREQVRAASPYQGMELLHGTELNIDPDGAVDWDADFLEGFDLCVASVHSHFTQTPQQLTSRFVRACENPYVNIIGHPTTRQIGRRAPIEPDWDEVFAAAAGTGTALEINSFPDRLDLPDELVLRAKHYGVRFAVSTDSHSTVHLEHMRFGVGLAQRAWLTTDDVINAWPLAELRRFVAAKRR
jgi:DNA polymerase (family 10)